MQMKDGMQASLAADCEEAEKLSRLAEAKFQSGDLTGCLEMLTVHTGRNIRYVQAKELLGRMKQEAQQQVDASNANTNAAKLLLEKIEALAMVIAGFFFLRSNSALAQIPHSVALTWEASATPDVNYNIYRSNTSGAYSNCL